MFRNNNQNPLSQFRYFTQNLKTFKQQMDQRGVNDYESAVQDLINSGQMTQEQFNEYSKMANQIMGMLNKR